MKQQEPKWKKKKISYPIFFLLFLLFIAFFYFLYDQMVKSTAAICYTNPPQTTTADISPKTSTQSETASKEGAYQMDLLIVKDYKTSLFVLPLKNEEYQTPLLVTVPDSFAKQSIVKEGKIATISWNGNVLETYPAKISAMTIERKKASTSPLFLYEKALEELIDTDKGLNTSITQAVFCLDGITNLTVMEKEALVYLGSDLLDVPVRQGTFKQLEDENLIQNGTFTNDIYIEITGENLNPSGKKVTFSMEKYRSGDGAYFLLDCIGNYKKGTWSYTIGSHAIS
ncbi:MAG TPA: hypothetical protein IAC14_03790 [Candidatus Scybalomonas excrementigallinarum]|nr:hypothetical protein [Candidatus Scybalomonas excrementigallinarum]